MKINCILKVWIVLINNNNIINITNITLHTSRFKIWRPSVGRKANTHTHRLVDNTNLCSRCCLAKTMKNKRWGSQLPNDKLVEMCSSTSYKVENYAYFAPNLFLPCIYHANRPCVKKKYTLLNLLEGNISRLVEICFPNIKDFSLIPDAG